MAGADLKLLPSPYFIGLSQEAIMLSGSATTLGTGSAAAANRAFYAYFTLPCSQFLTGISFNCTVTSSGNYDLGLYDAKSNVRLGSKGTTALTTGTVTWSPADPILLEAGKGYYAAWVVSAGTFGRHTSSILKLRLSGHSQEASALPLPATATPVQVTTAFEPYLALVFR
jgi:hypothetical protein